MGEGQAGETRRTMIKGFAAGTALCLSYGGGALPDDRSAAALPRARPEALGVSPDAVVRFVLGVNSAVGGLHSFMLLRHGQVAAEAWWAPYGAGLRHMLFSLSKSFTSTAVGLAVSEGLLTVDAPVLSFFQKEAPPAVGPNLRAMRVRHLLTMSTGHAVDATGASTGDPDGDWARGFLSIPVDHEPGTHFVYNSAATYMLSAIVQRLSGKTVLDYLMPRLFDPLGIAGPTWEKCPRGVCTGGWGLSVRTEDIARFGQLYLQKGRWAGRQVLPSSWVTEATSKHVSNGTGDESDWTQGYGYQFWRSRHGAYRGDGAFGQYCIVMPELDAVLAITSGVSDMQAVLNVVWRELLPGIGGAVSSAGPGLGQTLRGLGRTAPAGAQSSPTAGAVYGRTVRFAEGSEGIQYARLRLGVERSRVTLGTRDGERSYSVGYRSWLRDRHPLGRTDRAKIASRGAWTDDQTYTLQMCLLETPFVSTEVWRFEGGRVTVERHMNVGFGPTNLPTLVGRLE